MKVGREKSPAEQTATADRGEVLQCEVVSRNSRKHGFGFHLYAV